MEGLHYFLDARVPIPPMKVQEVDIGGPELLQRSLEGNVQRLGVVADVHDLLVDVLAGFEVGSVLRYCGIY